MQITITPMQPTDWPAVQTIYRQGILTGQATFETQTPGWPAWDAAHLDAGRLVAYSASEIVGWAALSPISARKAYAGVAEVSIYIAAAARGQRVGTALMAALIAAAEQYGIWTLQSTIFPENTASLALHKAHGFRTVGTRQHIAQHHGIWRDTVIVERRSKVVGVAE